MINKICEKESAGGTYCRDDDSSVRVLLNPLEVKNDGDLDEGRNIEDSSSKMNSHLETLQKSKDCPKVKMSKHTPKYQPNVKEQESKVAHCEEKIMDIRNHLESQKSIKI